VSPVILPSTVHYLTPSSLISLAARISAPPSAGLFTSRDAEMTLRCLCIRRLTFVLLSAPKNHFLLHLPTIQQNLVEVLRTTGLAASVHAEVYLCLRVLICRMGANVLGNLWPVILTELVRLLSRHFLQKKSLSDTYCYPFLDLCSCACSSRRWRRSRQTSQTR
jgi:hypothetical protein